MQIEVVFSTTELRDTLYDNRVWWKSISDMHVGQWLGYITVKIIEKYTRTNAIYNSKMKEFGPKVSYSEMYDLIYSSAWEQDFISNLHYNSEKNVWVIENCLASHSFFEEMSTKSYRHRRNVLGITVNDIFEGMLIADNIENKTIAQWLTQFAGEKIKELVGAEDLRDVTITVEPFLNLLGCGTHYKWADVQRILGLTYLGDEIEFVLTIDGNDIKIKDIQLPASMRDAIKKVKEEKEENKKQHREFTVGEMFTGLMLSKDYTVKQAYAEWLERAVQNLLNVKKEMPSDYSICLTHGTKINFRDAIDDFVTHTRANDKFEVIYSLSDECEEEGNSAIKFYDIKKVEE